MRWILRIVGYGGIVLVLTGAALQSSTVAGTVASFGGMMAIIAMAETIIRYNY